MLKWAAGFPLRSTDEAIRRAGSGTPIAGMRPALRLFTQLRVPRLTLYSGGPECSLCEVAKEALDELRAKARQAAQSWELIVRQRI